MALLDVNNLSHNSTLLYYMGVFKHSCTGRKILSCHMIANVCS